GFHRLDLEHSTRNLTSCKVATKSGYLLEGTKRSARLHDDGWHDMHLHARVRDELALRPGRKGGVFVIAAMDGLWAGYMHAHGADRLVRRGAEPGRDRAAWSARRRPDRVGRAGLRGSYREPRRNRGARLKRPAADARWRAARTGRAGGQRAARPAAAAR